MMKLCYVDETGLDGASPFLVMVGVIVDAQRLRRTQEDFTRLFDHVGRHPDKTVKELKAAELYRGNGVWRGVDGDTRHQILDEVCAWVSERKHTLALAAIDRRRFAESPLHDACDDDWIASALHIALQVQKAHQSASSNKGRTFLFFDVNKRREDPLAELLHSPPCWSDDYYGWKLGRPRLDQIVDSAFFARSHHVGLVQIADIYAYLFRRYAELADAVAEESHPGESSKLRSWIDQLAPRLLPVSHRWPQKSPSEAAKWYSELAPSPLIDLG